MCVCVQLGVFVRGHYSAFTWRGHAQDGLLGSAGLRSSHSRIYSPVAAQFGCCSADKSNTSPTLAYKSSRMAAADCTVCKMLNNTQHAGPLSMPSCTVTTQMSWSRNLVALLHHPTSIQGYVQNNAVLISEVQYEARDTLNIYKAQYRFLSTI